jgi:hypothetical protein
MFPSTCVILESEALILLEHAYVSNDFVGIYRFARLVKTAKATIACLFHTPLLKKKVGLEQVQEDFVILVRDDCPLECLYHEFGHVADLMKVALPRTKLQHMKYNAVRLLKNLFTMEILTSEASAWNSAPKKTKWSAILMKQGLFSYKVKMICQWPSIILTGYLIITAAKQLF